MSENAFGTGFIIPNLDQVVKGNVIIKKLSKYRYRITFSKIGKFLMYQVWNKDKTKINDKRGVGYASAKEWLKLVNIFNKDLEENGKPLFTPTTIMETNYCDKYAFVIHKVYLNSSGKVVFTVSTKEISLEKNNTSKKMIRLPEGKINNVRFDIDNAWDDFVGFFTNTIPNFFTETIPTAISYDIYIQAVPTGKPRNKQGMGVPGVCWEDSQLSFQQKMAVDRFYIAYPYTNQVTLTEENRVYYDDKINGYYAYICTKFVD
jgi:hypothetical protein